MIRLFLVLLFFFGYESVNAQVIAKEINLYPYYETKNKFEGILTKNGKDIFNLMISDYKLDTLNTNFTSYGNYFEFTNAKYLQNRSYTYISLVKSGGQISKTEYYQYNFISDSNNKKIFILYFTDNKNEFDEICYYEIY